MQRYRTGGNAPSIPGGADVLPILSAMGDNPLNHGSLGLPQLQPSISPSWFSSTRPLPDNRTFVGLFQEPTMTSAPVTAPWRPEA